MPDTKHPIDSAIQSAMDQLAPLLGEQKARAAIRDVVENSLNRVLGRRGRGFEVGNANKPGRGGLGGKRSDETRARMIAARWKGLPRGADRDELVDRLTPYVNKWASMTIEDRKNLIAGIDVKSGKLGGRAKKAPVEVAEGAEGHG